MKAIMYSRGRNTHSLASGIRAHVLPGPTVSPTSIGVCIVAKSPAQLLYKDVWDLLARDEDGGHRRRADRRILHFVASVS